MRLLDHEKQKRLGERFASMMRALWEQKGATLSVNIVTDPRAVDFIDAHADALSSSFTQVQMSERMRARLERSTWIFSGMKAIREMGEAFPSLLDENGERKPFERFLNDVRKVDETYNQHYLRAEYEFAAASAQMAAKWERFAEDGDRYNLQYRTAGDDRVRPEHAALDGITLPPSDSFWESYFPPNGWRCRCDVVQVRKSKYPVTPHDEAMQLGEMATAADTKNIFRFNPGIQQRVFPAANPYTIDKCSSCKLGNNIQLARSKQVPNEKICAACKLINHCSTNDDSVYGKRLKIAQGADLSEIVDNRRAAAAILDCFGNTKIIIRPHFHIHKMKNPEYAINGLIADRKGIESEKGMSSAFSSAIKQGCQAVVIDLDMKMRDQIMRTERLAKEIYNRHRDFQEGKIKECYVVYHDRAVKITIDDFVFRSKNDSKDKIQSRLDTIA